MLLAVLLPVAAASDTGPVGPVCKVFENTLFANHDLSEQDANTAAECCSVCQATPGCGFWTFAAPTTCQLKTSNAGSQPAASTFTSGCRWENCSAAPPAPPAPPPPPPSGQVCNVGSVCSARYSKNAEGCCPYKDAVCCPNNQTCCPTGTTCVDSGSYATTCKGAAANESIGLSVCKPGAALPFSNTLPNVLIIGDSVSIGYTPNVTAAMSQLALVQHSPYDVRDGGAEETAYGVQCLDYMLRSPAGNLLRPDVIMFNWGLHDGPLGNSTVPGQAGLPDVYAAQLEVITQKLMATEPQAKLLFALTSPYMCSAINDGCVVNLNNQAAAIMAKYEIPTINLHDSVVAVCGPPPQPTCFNSTGCFCPHCNGRGATGYAFLTDKVIVPALTKLLPPPPRGN